MPVEELQELQKKEQGPVPGTGQPTLLLPLMMNPAGGPRNSQRRPLRCRAPDRARRQRAAVRRRTGTGH